MRVASFTRDDCVCSGADDHDNNDADTEGDADDADDGTSSLTLQVMIRNQL